MVLAGSSERVGHTTPCRAFGIKPHPPTLRKFGGNVAQQCAGSVNFVPPLHLLLLLHLHLLLLLHLHLLLFILLPLQALVHLHPLFEFLLGSVALVRGQGAGSLFDCGPDHVRWDL